MADKGEITTKFKVDISELKKEITEANQNLKLARAEFNAASAGMDDWAKSSDGIKAKLTQLGSTLVEENKKLESYKKQQEKLDEAYKENGKRADELRAKLAQLAASGVAKTSDEYKKYQKALSEVEKEQLSNKKASDDMKITILNQQAAVNKTEKEIRGYEKSLSDLGNEADDAAKSVENVGDSAKSSSDGFTVIKGAISNLISEGFSALISACKDAVTSISDLSDETREYREDIGKLKTAFESAGKSADLAKDTYKKFYSVLGEEDRSVEAVSHLAKFVEAEEDMAKWADIVTGVWGTFGDSLPVEGLTEASNETVKTGAVTGVLADALNWATQEGETFGIKLKENIEFTELSKKELEALTKAQRNEYGERKAQYEMIEEYNKAVNNATSAEDFFNLALQECTTEQERERLVTETLNGLYADAAGLYKENNKSIIAARNASSDYTDSMAELGEEMEPVNTELTGLKQELIKGLAPILKKDVIPLIKKFIKSFKNEGTISKFTKSISNLAKKVLPPATKAVKFLGDHFGTLVKITFGAVTAFAAFNATMKVASLINSVKTAVSGLSTGVGIVTKAQTLWNTAMSANPLGAVLTAVGLLATGIYALVESQESAEESTRLLNERQQETITAAEEAAESYDQTKEAAAKNAAAQEANVNYAQNNLLPMLQSVVDKNGEVKKGEEERAEFILGKLNEALGTEYTQLSDIVDENGKIKDSIYDAIKAKKAQILLDAHEETYLEAIKNVTEAKKARALQEMETQKQNEIWQKKYQEYSDAQAELEDIQENKRGLYTEREILRKKLRVSELKKEEQAQREVFDSESQKLGELERNVRTYYSNIADYEDAQTASMEGNTEKAIGCLNNLSTGFITAESTVELSVKEQKEILEEQAETYKRIAEKTREEYINGVKGVSEETVRIAEEQAENAKKEYYKVGGSVSEAIGEGAKEKGIDKSLSEMMEEAANIQSQEALDKWFDVGNDITKGIAEGINDKLATGELTGAVKGAMEFALAAAKRAADIHSPSRLFKNVIGKNIGLGIAKGIADTTRNIVKTVKSQVDSIESAYDTGKINPLFIGNAYRNQLAEMTRQLSVGNNGFSFGNGISSNTTNYTQIINAPKAPSRIEIYRQTKNLLALKGGS